MIKSMKRNKIIITLFTGMTLLSACHDLNLNPLSYGSTESWYSDETEVEMAVNELYRNDFWLIDEDTNTDWSDDNIYRESLTEFQNVIMCFFSFVTPQCGCIWNKEVIKVRLVFLKEEISGKLIPCFCL